MTLEEFKIAYLEIIKQPDTFDSPKLRERFLDELINRKLFGYEARKSGEQNDERQRYKIEAYRDKQFRDAHFKHIIEPQIKIDSTEVKKAYSFTKEKRKIKHLFTQKKIKADSLYKMLIAGANWDDLALELFDDIQLAQTGGDLGWVHWDQMEYDMAETAFTLVPKTFSKPIQSTHGYHIIYIDDFEKELLISEYDRDLHFDKVKVMVRKMKGDKIANYYISDLMSDKKIKINPASINLLKDKLKKILTRPATQFDQMRGMQLTDNEILRVEENFWDYRNEVLVYVDGLKLTIADFIGMLNYVPYEAIQQGFKTTLNYVIRDFVLSNEAKKLNLSMHYKFIDLKTKLYEDYLLQLKIKRALVKQVKLSVNDIRKYLKKSNISSELENLDPNIRRQFLSDKRRIVVADYILNLRNNVHIEKETTSLHAYYDNLNGIKQ